MADKPDTSSAPKRRKSDLSPLESWKAIANYLNRSVRTVRRWEASEGLPVHRHRHNKGFSVYAIRSELDGWRADHRASPSDGPGAIPNSGHYKWQLHGVHIAAMLVIASLVGGMATKYILRASPAPDNDVSSRQAHLETAAYWPESAAQVHVAPIFSAWAEGRVQDALLESQNIVRQLPELPSDVRTHVVDYLIVFSLNLGRVADAKTLLADIPNGDRREGLDARIAFASGDKTRVPEVLRSGMKSPGLSAAQSDVFHAMTAMKSGDHSEAKARLQSAISELDIEDQGYFFVALEMLAGVLTSEGDLSGAVAVLERTMPQRHAAAKNRSGLFWLVCQRQLARAYREVGRMEDAEEVENKLRGFLILSDEDFPLARSLAAV